IAAFVRAGEEVRVLDNDSGEDLTAVTFAQIILEEERRKTGLLPLPMLRRVIQQGEATLQDIAGRRDKGMEAIGPPGRAVQELGGRGARWGKAFLDEILSTPQKQLEALQKRIDDRVKQSVERITSLPAVQKELTRIEKSIARLEERLGRLRGGPRKPDS